MVDAYSKFPFVRPMTIVATENTIEQLEAIFAIEGLPNTLVSENGTQFTGIEFKIFCDKYGIHHVRSPVYHPQSNGAAEPSFGRLIRVSRKHWLTEWTLKKLLGLCW